MPSRLPRLALFAIGLSVCLLVLACSSSDSTPSTSAAASNTTGATSSSQATATAGTQYATAGPELSAYALLDAAGYSAALGEPVTAVEDDGVVPDRYGCEIGQARVLTQAGLVLTVGLHTAASTDEAAQVYQTFANFGDTPTPIPGVGDQSGYLNGLAAVRKGTQVLVVQGQPGPDLQSRLDQVKIGGGDPVAATNAAIAVTAKAPPALAAKMSGASCRSPSLGVPSGAVGPCLTTPDEIEQGLSLQGVTVTPVISDQPPSSECEYNLGTDGVMDVYVTTETQLESSIDQTTGTAQFASDSQQVTLPQYSEYQYQTFQSGRFQGFGATGTRAGIDEEFVFQDSAPQSRQLGGPALIANRAAPPVPGIGGSIIMEILQSSSDNLIKPADCKDLMKLMIFDLMNDAHPDGGWGQTVSDYEDALNKMTEYCQSAASGGGN